MPPTDSTIALRDAQVADAEQIVALLHGAFEEYRNRLDPPSGALTETAASIGALLAREHALLAETEGRAVGCVFYTLHRAHAAHDADELYLHRLAVLPEARRRGVGGRLVDAVEAQARALGLDFVSLGVRIVLRENRRYYERRGYRVAAFAPHPGFSRMTYIVMRKRVGPPLPRAVVVEEWSPHWAEQYAQAAAQLHKLLGDALASLHHIGSTAVPGMAARPTLDLLGVANDLDRIEARDVHLLMHGWQPRGESGIPGCRSYSKGGAGRPSHRLRIYAAGHPEIDDHLALVAYLNAHLDEADAYAAHKRALAAQHPWSIEEYRAGREPLRRALGARARAWFRSQQAGSAT